MGSCPRTQNIIPSKVLSSYILQCNLLLGFSNDGGFIIHTFLPGTSIHIVRFSVGCTCPCSSTGPQDDMVKSIMNVIVRTVVQSATCVSMSKYSFSIK